MLKRSSQSGACHSSFSTGKAQRERLAEHSVLHPSSSGKERDEETGFGYFGARYYDSELLSGWMSVDPMSDKYPSLSPYAYCAWNPIKLVDPDGRDFEKTVDHNKRTIVISAQFTTQSSDPKVQEALKKSVLAWNRSLFCITMNDNNGEKIEYTVSFNINNGNGPENSVTFIPDNVFDQCYPDYSTAGGVSDGSGIAVKMSLALNNNQILAHEMGHCLGMSDELVSGDGIGLMYATNHSKSDVCQLSNVSMINLLVTCGFDFGPFQKGHSASKCVGTNIFGEVPSSYSGRFRESNISRSSTKHFFK